MGLFVPGGVVFRGAQTEGAAEIDDARSGGQHAWSKFHGNFWRRRQEDEVEPRRLDRFRSAHDSGGTRGPPHSTRGRQFPVVEQHGFDRRVARQETDQFRAAVPGVPRDPDFV